MKERFTFKKVGTKASNIHKATFSRDVIQSYLVFDNMAIIHRVKYRLKLKGRLRVHETPVLEVVFVTLIENSSVITDDTQGPRKYPHLLK